MCQSRIKKSRYMYTDDKVLNCNSELDLYGSIVLS